MIAPAAVLLAAAVIFFTCLPCLALRRPEGRLAALFPLERRNPGFAISYLHSVARLPAVEHFRFGPGGTLELYRTEYRGLGAGLPFGEEGGSVHLEDGWIVIEGLARRFPSVSLSPMPLTEHRLRVNGREIDLVSLAGGRTITLSIERKSLVRRLVLGRRMGYIKP